MNAFSVGQTNVAVLFFVLDIQVFLELVETVENLLAYVKGTIVARLVLNLFGHLNVRIKIVGVFLFYDKRYTSLLSRSISRVLRISL